MDKESKIKTHEFETHKMSCAKCQNVDIKIPSTLVECCLFGAPLLRDYLNWIVSPSIKKKQQSIKKSFMKESDGKIYQSTKSKVKQLTKFK